MAPGLSNKDLDNGTGINDSYLSGSDPDLGIDASFENPLQDRLPSIAVVGFSIKFPQDSTSPQDFWQVLVEGRSAMTEFPKDRLNIDAFYHPDTSRHDTINLRGGHFLKEDLGAFDAPFFSVTATEAASMDPQQRMLLETTYRALENAGQAMEKVAGSRTSVHIGSFTRDYSMILHKDPELPTKYSLTSLEASMLANRISWFYDLVGPSVTLDTACSSSLMALHMACQSLRDGESTMGLVGGSNLFFNPEPMAAMTNLNFLSTDSRCFSFDHRANGYSRGEGFGIVVIKLLPDAIRDGDTIRAVIRASSSNHNGKRVTVTQPSAAAQEALIRNAYEIAGLDLKTTRYFEAHGTGTPVGDPIEASAIAATFKNYRSPSKPLYIGAVKPNIGHLESTSGLAGLIKSILILERGIIPPNIGFERPNPKIDVSGWNIKFPVENTAWPSNGLRRVSVNSFGFGGANVHVILDDAYNYLTLRNLTGNHSTVQTPPSAEDLCGLTGALTLPTAASVRPQGLSKEVYKSSRPKLLVFSTSDEAGISRVATVYHQYFTSSSLAKSDKDDLDSLAYTLSMRRTSLTWRSFVIARSIDELQESLEDRLSKPVRSSRKHAKLGFVFTGQGAQWYGMGRELLAYPVFENSFKDADLYLKGLGCQWSLLDELVKDEEVSNLNSPDFAQPICTALQIALIDLLQNWGIRASAVIGHSSGEIAAAYCAGGLSRESAWKVAYYRGMVSATLANLGYDRGAMMSVGLSEVQIQSYLDQVSSSNIYGSLTLGCVNSPKNVTITGDESLINTLQSLLHTNGIFARKLQVGVAYHSPYMEQVAGDYKTLLTNIQTGNRQQNAVMVSSVTGTVVGNKDLSQGNYWVSNLVSTVRFSDALSQLLFQSVKSTRKKLGSYRNSTIVDDLLEIGPHSALQGPIKDILKQADKAEHITYSSMLVRHMSAIDTSLRVAGHMYCLGYPVKLSGINSPRVKAEDRPVVLTDLPEYPFNHSQKYWLESRLSRGFRFRKFPRNSLLGSTVPDWNPLEARWRNIIKFSENPWIEDHKINGTYLYPGAGMLVMAIEAAKQTADPARRISGYELKDVTFHKALAVTLALEGVETQFYLRPVKDANDKNYTWNEFRLCILDNEDWSESCRGSIAVKYEEGESEIDGGKERGLEIDQFKSIYHHSKRNCVEDIDSIELYESLREWGFGYGPKFQVLREISHNNDGGSVASIQLPQWSVHPSDSYVIHPTTLDGMGQLALPALSRGVTKPIPTMVPTRIRKAWIANTGFCRPDASELVGCAQATFKGYRSIDASLVALDKTVGDPRVVIQGFEMTVVESSIASQGGQESVRRLFYNIDWKPDMELMDSHQILKYCEAARPAMAQPIQFCEDLEFLCFLFISKALSALEKKESTNPKLYLHKYIKWMKMKKNSFKAGQLPISRLEWEDYLNDQDYQDALFRRVQGRNIQGQFYGVITQHLQKILYGEIDALEFLFRDDLISDFYRDAEGPTVCFKILARYLDAVVHKNPGMRILELGAGTGGATVPILDILMRHGEGEHGAPRFGHYDFTDISPSFFEKARGTFKSSKDRMRFTTLDIEEDPLKQGYEAGTYDIIVASNVLHATKDLNVTLQNTRKLLKPGGHLILFEATNPSIIRTGFAFGLLPGWWSSVEKNRQWGPTIAEQDWHEILMQNGFSGTDFIFRDYLDDRCHETSMMVSTASELAPNPLAIPKTVILVADDCSPQQELLARKVKISLERLGSPSCDVLPIHNAGAIIDLEEKFVIFLPEIDDPFLRDIRSEQFGILKQLILLTKGILWVTQGGGLSAIKPEVDMVTGLSRVVCSEDSKLVFVTLALESTEPETEQHVAHIIKVFQNTVSKPATQFEPEFAEKDGLLYINRVIEANYLSEAVHQRILPQESKVLGFGQAPALTLSVDSPGLLDSLTFIEDSEFEKPLRPKDIEIEVIVSGVNFMDILIALGRVAESSLGAECAGIIRRVGSEADLQPGDRVCVCTMGTYKTFVRCDTQCAIKIPDWLSFAEAAALTTTSITAYYALYMAARLKSKESILIHAGAGGTGQTAIQIAQSIGAEIYTTVSSEKKKQLLIDLYAIPEDHIFYSRNTSFAQGIQRITQNRGVDVVLNSLTGESLVASWESVAPFGRFVEIGKKDIYSHGKLPMFPFARNVTFAAVDVANMTRERPALIREILGGILALVENRELHAARPLQVYPVSEITEAFRFLQSGKNPGKVVVDMGKNYLVPCVLKTKATYRFEENATYVISGGLGGIGRSTARWMVDRGARNLVLLSRSGPQNTNAAVLLRDLQAKGARVETPVCDVTNWDSISSVFAQIVQTMPPIKGCIQGSMVLKDHIFEGMKFEDYKATVEPKVQGSWNLHKLCPNGLDFFVLLSSVCGIFGSRGQSNYASGNTFQDTLARHRNSIGEKAVSLDLGMMLDIGLVAESKNIKKGMDAAGFYIGITETELSALLDYYCNPTLKILTSLESQIVMGLGTPASLAVMKIEEPYWMSKPLFRHFWQMGGTESSSSSNISESIVDIAMLLSSVENHAAAVAIVCEALVKKLSKALSTPQEDIDTSRPVHYYGVDSLVAVELRNWFAKEISADIAIFDIMGSASILALSSIVANKSLYLKSGKQVENSEGK